MKRALLSGSAPQFHRFAGQHDPLGHLLDLSGKAAAEKVLSLLFLQKAL